MKNKYLITSKLLTNFIHAIIMLLVLCSLSITSTFAAAPLIECTPKHAIAVMNIDTPEVSPLLPIGSSITGDIQFPETTVTCTNHATGALSGTMSIRSNSDRYIGEYNKRATFQSNVPGIGYQFGMNYRINGQSTSSWIAESGLPESTITVSALDSADLVVTPKVNLIKTSQTVGSGELVGWTASQYITFGYSGSASEVNYRFNGKIIPGGCSVTGGQNLIIKLDDVQKSSLPAVGSNWGESAPQDIQLTCIKNTRVYITFSGNQSSESTDPSILENNGTAKGIGIQLLNNNHIPYSLGEKDEVIEHSGTTTTIPVSARYIRTGDLVSGSVDSSATYTLNYQ